MRCHKRLIHSLFNSKFNWEQAVIYSDAENKHHIKKCRKLMQDKGKTHEYDDQNT